MNDKGNQEGHVLPRDLTVFFVELFDKHHMCLQIRAKSFLLELKFTIRRRQIIKSRTNERYVTWFGLIHYSAFSAANEM